MDGQVTTGGNYSYDISGTQYVSGTYTTNAASMDGYGTVRASQTVGVSTRGAIVVGTYTTDSTFGSDGQQLTGVTNGLSNNLAGNPTGYYQPTSTFNQTWGVMDGQATTGGNYSYDISGTQYVSGTYTTNAASIDGYGTVRASQTVGVSTRGAIVVGTYTTDSTFGSDGQQLTGVTNGTSNNLAGNPTGYYQTTSTFNQTWGVMDGQVTTGGNYSYDISGTQYVPGTYTTNAASIEATAL